MKYVDEYILALNNLHNKSEQIRCKEEAVFNGAFVMKIPECFEDMDEQSVQKRFLLKDRPQYVKTTPDNKAIMTMDILNGEKELKKELEQLKEVIQIVYPKFVLYDEGETGSGSYWFDCKVYENKKNHYKLYFLLERKIRVLGSFQCDFSDYDRWKGQIIEMLEQIE